MIAVRDPATIAFQIVGICAHAQKLAAETVYLVATLPPYCRDVYDALPEAPGISRPAIEIATGRTKGTINEALSRLKRMGLVGSAVPAGRGFGRYWRVK